jgi:ATP-dependent DNA helicase RecG
VGVEVVTRSDIVRILEQLDGHSAGSFEGQELDFKRWVDRSLEDSLKTIVAASVCMANGGGGWVVVGVDDKGTGPEAIRGVPEGVDLERLRQAVASRTEPQLWLEAEFVTVGPAAPSVLFLKVPDCFVTTSDGQSWKRIGDQCRPMTGSVMLAHLQTRGQVDVSAQVVDARIENVVSASAVERLRSIAAREAPRELLIQDDLRLLESLGLVVNSKPTIAALLLAGREEAIRRFVPAYKWTFLRMKKGSEYSDRADGFEAVPVAVERISDRIMADNPIDTVQFGLLHFEYRKFPELAVREALMNAFGHSDYTVASPITVEQYSDRLVISNPGCFIGGVNPGNILRHSSVSRNIVLMEALLRLRLVNRTHLGVRRMYEAMLLDGKAPPVWDDLRGGVRVVMFGHRMEPAFRAFVDEENATGRGLDVEDMLILSQLGKQAELTTSDAVALTQETLEEARLRLSRLSLERGYLAKGGSGKGTYWRLRRQTHERLGGAGVPDRDRRIDWTTARAQVESALLQRAKREEPGLTNADIREITAYSRSQVTRLMAELRDEGSVLLEGHGRGARYYHARHPN